MARIKIPRPDTAKSIAKIQKQYDTGLKKIQKQYYADFDDFYKKIEKLVTKARPDFTLDPWTGPKHNQDNRIYIKSNKTQSRSLTIIIYKNGNLASEICGQNDIQSHNTVTSLIQRIRTL